MLSSEMTSRRTQRKSIRLPHYDYRSPGAYFLTICTYKRQRVFGAIEQNEMKENSLGKIARGCWLALPNHFADVDIDAFVVMPNHVHGIVFLTANSLENVGAQHAAPASYGIDDNKATEPVSLSAIIRSFKSAVTKRVNELRGTRGAYLWQRNYYERVIRDENELDKIRQYIISNPALWSMDWENPIMSRMRSDHATEVEAILATD